MTPPHLTAKAFEHLLMAGAARCPLLCMGRYGVQVSLIAGEWRPVPSLPDFEGILRGGRQFLIEAKVCCGASFEVRADKIKPRQVRHLLARSALGALCHVVIHFNARKLITREDPAETWALPVNDALPVWRAFLEEGRTSSISRGEAARLGTRVAWTSPKGCRKPLPDLAALLGADTTILT